MHSSRLAEARSDVNPGKMTYREWNFYSDGSMGEGEATWDAGARTMTSVCKPDKDGVTVTTTADCSEAGGEKWKIGPPYLGEVFALSFEGDGSILSIISGPPGGR